MLQKQVGHRFPVTFPFRTQQKVRGFGILVEGHISSSNPHRRAKNLPKNLFVRQESNITAANVDHDVPLNTCPVRDLHPKWEAGNPVNRRREQNFAAF
jgi:hypothetical protein